MNFQWAQSAVRAHLIDLPPAVAERVPEFINLAIREAAERHNFRFMARLLAAQTTVNNRILVSAKPALWKEAGSEPNLLLPNGRSKFPPLEWIPSRSEAQRRYAETLPTDGSPPDTGAPEGLLETADSIEVFPFPDDKSGWPNGNYQVRIPYWEFPAELVNPNDTNWLLKNAPLYVVMRAAAIGFLMNHEEERAALYSGSTDQRAGPQTAFSELGRVIARDKRARLPDRLSVVPLRGVFSPVRRTH